MSKDDSSFHDDSLKDTKKTTVDPPPLPCVPPPRPLR